MTNTTGAMGADLVTGAASSTPHGPIEPVEFTGKTGEWFGIWIVNLLLTILTLGIFSAWAKVRKEQYFKRNTSIGGRNFDYHATGGQILIGRLIIAAGFLALNLAASFAIGLYFILILALVAVLPWLIVRSLRFNARVTSWSNVRFDFAETYGNAFQIFFLAPIGVALTAYTTAPLLTRARTRFAVNGHSLGDHRFHFDSEIGPFYKAFGIALGIGFLATVIAMSVWGGTFTNTIAMAGEEVSEGAIIGAIIAMYAILLLGIVPAFLLYGALLRNHIYASTVLEGGHRLVSTINPWKLVWIKISNAFAAAFTLGLALPWTQIRLARYLAEHTGVQPNGSLDDIRGRIEAQASAVGDAYTDFEGLDLGLPI